MDRPRNLAIDLLKGLAITSVLILHSTPGGKAESTWPLFHIRQAVPVFIILLAMGALSSVTRLRDASWLRRSRRFYVDRFWRVGIPYAIAVAAMLAAQVALSLVVGPWKVDLEWIVLLGWTPIGGPGSYYIAVVLQWLLIAPLVVASFVRFPRLTVATALAVNAAYLLAVPYVPAIAHNGQLYDSLLLRQVGALALGMWIAIDPNPWTRRNRWILWGAAAAVAYMVARTLAGRPLLPFVASWEPENVLTSFYAAFLVMLALKYFPKTSHRRGLRMVGYFGRASLHVYLFQVAFFGALVPARLLGLLASRGVTPAGPVVLLFSLAVCLAVGSGWFACEAAARASHSQRRASGVLRSIDTLKR